MSEDTPLTDLSAVEYIERLQGDVKLVCTDANCLSYPRRVSPNRPYSARLAIESPTCSECGSELAVSSQS
jgi:hypothetical protein